MVTTVPLIYAPKRITARLNWRERVYALMLALPALAVLVTAVLLVPSGTGIGTHMALGLAPCGFERNTGLPCATCGMTTSFSWFVRGNLAKSFYVQPMGTVVALLSGLTFVGATYVAVTGRPAHRLLRLLPLKSILLALTAFFFFAWGWKVLLRVKGWDG